MLVHRLVNGRIEKIECQMVGGESENNFFKWAFGSSDFLWS
jgi:hypothetical protein